MSALSEYPFTRTRVGENVGVFSAPSRLARALAPVFDAAEREMLIVVAMDVANHVMGFETVDKGTLSGSDVKVGEVLCFHVRLHAPYIVVMHDQPSGKTEPSAGDLTVTAEIVKAGRILDSEVLDHIIVGHFGRYDSFRDRRYIR